MIQTPIKLGSQLSLNRGEWDDVIDYPNIEKTLTDFQIFILC
jgi:CRISPR-associated protein Csh1